MASLEEISDAMAAVVEAAGKSVVTVDARRGRSASGVVWGDGKVLTSVHVIESDEGIQVLDEGGSRPATLAGQDHVSDLALLAVEGLAGPAADRGSSGALKLGSLVLALGRPRELQVSLGTLGSLAASRRSWRGAGLEQLIQTDATMYGGFSGGPLLDSTGKLVGINSWYYGRGTTRSLPVEQADRVASSLAAHGRVRHAYLGVGTQPVYLSEASKGDLDQESGLMVISIDAEGPAAKAGVLQGDTIVGLGETRVSRMRELFHALRQLEVGSAQPLKVVRAGEVKDLQLTLGERPE